MFQSNDVQAHRGPVLGALKFAAPAMAFALGIAAASASQADAIFLQSASMNQTYTAHIYSQPYPTPGYTDQHVYLAPMVFTAYDGVGPTGDATSLLAFCVDIFHNIGLGTVNLQYDDTQPFASNSGSPATLLTSAQKVQVGRLANYGQLVYAGSDADKAQRLAGLQGAIWEVINPTYTVLSFNTAVDNYISAYSNALTYTSAIADHGPVGSKVTFITETGKYGTKAAHQSFIFAAVPEPGAWALMLVGFGAAGGMLRRARQRPAALNA